MYRIMQWSVAKSALDIPPVQARNAAAGAIFDLQQDRFSPPLTATQYLCFHFTASLLQRPMSLSGKVELSSAQPTMINFFSYVIG